MERKSDNDSSVAKWGTGNGYFAAGQENGNVLLRFNIRSAKDHFRAETWTAGERYDYDTPRRPVEWVSWVVHNFIF